MVKKASHARKWPLTIYLIDERYEDTGQILETKQLNDWDKKALLLEDRVVDVYVKRERRNPPKWAGFFEPQIPKSEFGQSESPATLALTKVENRIFALAFGTSGRHLLREGVVDDSFGFRVVLNLIEPNSIKSIDRKRFDDMLSHARVQTAFEANLRQFGFDIERDIVQAVTGSLSDELKKTYGRNITGRDALAIGTTNSIVSVHRDLSEFLRISKEETYKAKFQILGQISLVRPPDDAGLNAELVKRLTGFDLDGIELTIPEIVDWDRIRTFGFTGSPNAVDDTFPRISSFVNDHASGRNKNDFTLEKLKSKRIFGFDENGDVVKPWSVFRCLNVQIKVDGATFVLSDGRWFKIESSFVERIESYFANQIERFQPSRFPAFNPRVDFEFKKGERQKSENAYNMRIAKTESTKLMSLDRNTIRITGQDPIEPCDIFSIDREFIHVKRSSSSQTMSHLFAQGYVAAEAFHNSAEFRTALNAELPEEFRLPDPQQQVDPRQFCVVYAIVQDGDGTDVRLPFFSKVNLKQFHERLRRIGYEVSIGKIHVKDWNIRRPRRSKKT